MKHNVRNLHSLEACYVRQKLDYMHFEFLGSCMFRKTVHDCIHKVCSRQGTVEASESSSATGTSSSPGEEASITGIVGSRVIDL